MELRLRAALIERLSRDPFLRGQLNAVQEETPAPVALPWLAIATSASADWGCKTAPGREVRVALELHCRGDAPDTAADLVAAIEATIEAMPREQGSFTIAGIRFLRGRAQQRANNRRAILIEYRFRLLAR